MDGRDAESRRATVLHSEFAELKADVDRLRTELSMLVLEHDDLVFHECKNIETAYLFAFGALELRIHETECAIARQKRKFELVQAKRNRQERVDLSEIERILDREFAEYQARLDEQIRNMNEALERRYGQPLSEEATKELKSLYRSIVKALHPDLHPDISPGQVRLFQNAVEAYAHGDVQALRIIGTMILEPVLSPNEADGISLLTKDRERIDALCKEIKKQTANVKSRFPYTMKSLVRSESQIRARKGELEIKLTDLNEVLALYAARTADC